LRTKSLVWRTFFALCSILIVAPEDPGEAVRLRAAGRFQRRNFALACSATAAFLGRLDPERAAVVAAALEIPGRLERVPGDPPALLDAAHNPDGAAALAEALPDIARGRPVIAVLAILADKDAKAIIDALAPALHRAVCTTLPAPSSADGTISHHIGGFSARRRGLGGSELARICSEVGLSAEVEAGFDVAVARGRELALETGGVLLVTGSHYALAPARVALALCED